MTDAAAPRTASAIIDSWPSPKAFGDDIGVKLSHVHVMKVRGSIPARRWPAVAAAAKARGIGITLDDVVKAHEQPAPDHKQGATPAPDMGGCA